MRLHPSIAAVTLAFVSIALAQTAPRETVTADIHGKKISVEYGRPSLKGRKFDELLKQLPADRMWRAGSEQITTFNTEADVMIGGKKVSAGKYSLYVHCPANGSYSLVLNTVLGQPLGKIYAAAPANLADAPWPHFNYSKEIGDKEAARAAMTQATVPATDQLTYKLETSAKGARLQLSWGDQSWSVDIAPAH